MEDEVNRNPKKLIWGSINYNNKDLPKPIKGYISNPSVYNFEEETFSSFFYLFNKLILDGFLNPSYSFYDLLIKNNETLFQNKKHKLIWKNKFAKMTKDKMTSLKSLMNFINPTSNKVQKKISDDHILEFKNKVIIKIDKATNFQDTNSIKMNTYNFLMGKNYVIFDRYWQKPANTEEMVAKNIMLRNLDNLFYIGFPWATLIDAKTTNNQKVENELIFYLKLLKKIASKKIHSSLNNVTSAQHILSIGTNANVSRIMKDGLKKEIKSLRIKYLFFSHKKFTDNFLSDCKIKSLPLTAVKFVKKPKKSRKYLASFVGAAKHNLYRSDIRSKIIEKFKSSKKIKVFENKEWFYQKVVYNTNFTYKTDELKNKDDKYVNLLEQSFFGFCPSGTGPNSIRLWECIRSDVIPIILKNNLDLPGPIELWKKAAIILDELDTDLSKLENFIVSVQNNKNYMNEKFDALQILKKLLTDKNIVYPIVELDNQLSFGNSYDY